MKKENMKNIAQKVLALAVVLVLVCAVGNALNVQAQTFSSEVYFRQLKKDDVIDAGVKLWAGSKEYVGRITLDGNSVSFTYDYESEEQYASFSEPVQLKEIIREDMMSCGSYRYHLTFVTYDPNAGEESALSEEQKAQLREEAWKKSPQNPANYLPEVTLADGSSVVSTVPAHFTDSGKNGGVSGVFSTEELGDFYRAVGADGNGVHLHSYKSLCGPLMKQLFADHAKALGEEFGAEATVADIFEMQTEIRDKDYRLVEVVTESSEAVNIVIGLQGDLLKAAEAGADFAVLVYSDGEMTVCLDTDEEMSTVTINTTKTSGIYAIVYAPEGTFDGIE